MGRVGRVIGNTTIFFFGLRLIRLAPIFALIVGLLHSSPRTSDGGNWNDTVSLPKILIKNKVDQMLPSSYIRSLLVSILFCLYSFILGLKWSLFVLYI